MNMSYKEETVTCPYDKHHLILKHRLSTHLCKCRKQYNGNDIEYCPFNSTHRIYKPELQYHIEHCPDRKILDSFIYVVGDSSRNETKLIDIDIPESSENWDDFTPSGSYLDVKDKVVNEQPILRVPCGLSKSQRKQFFESEMKRFGNFTSTKNEECCLDQSAAVKAPSSSLTKRIPSELGLGREAKIKDSVNAGCFQPSDDDEEFTIVLKSKGRGKPLH